MLALAAQIGERAERERHRRVLADLESQGLVVVDKDVVRSAKHTLELSPADAQLRDAIIGVLKQAGLEAPTLGDRENMLIDLLRLNAGPTESDPGSTPHTVN